LKEDEKMPKVKFGFKNAYYSKLINTEGVISYATPKKLAGAVSMTLSPVGEDVEFYADDSLYFSDITNNGYDG
jgi:phi13 family phage major tail protein